ncbi:phosphatase PAP2 family protein [Marinomonas ostreistagni]|uniref:Phosphatase PAP2 family protein n=1 Tax=Marinomonas ostreistagni TaxID=359209 RepID=A0ABS0ZBK0_9GAMM|nr:phosphatase PAP2 family protein [Marinomonas ostreistagni]MBJ7551015.1 phosphatase PAP2 family protein [Marinomonas ostreistagni]
MNNTFKHRFNPFIRDKSVYYVTLLAIIFQWSLYLFNNEVQFTLSLYRGTFLVSLVLSACLMFLGYFFFILFKKSKRPLKELLEYVLIPIKEWHETLNFIALTLSISIVASIYTSVKSSIPLFVPFYLDPILYNMDQFIFFGNTPWELTHIIFSTPESTAFLNLMYNLWFLVIWVFLTIFMVMTNLKIKRLQFIISFLLCWIVIGNISAIIFSSVGPCFYGSYYVGHDPYEGLMNLLTHQDNILASEYGTLRVWSLPIQDLLWESYVNKTNDLGLGISALPSMHVSITAIISIALYSINKKLGAVAWIYTCIIMIASVHLGWHYAVDSALALVLTTAIWFFVKNVLLNESDKKKPLS